jgi:hypothetical protein
MLCFTVMFTTQRTHDHEGLLSGAAAAQCVPVFVFDPEALAAEGPVTVSARLHTQLPTCIRRLATRGHCYSLTHRCAMLHRQHMYTTR